MRCAQLLIKSCGQYGVGNQQISNVNIIVMWVNSTFVLQSASAQVTISFRYADFSLRVEEERKDLTSVE